MMLRRRHTHSYAVKASRFPTHTPKHWEFLFVRRTFRDDWFRINIISEFPDSRNFEKLPRKPLNLVGCSWQLPQRPIYWREKFSTLHLHPVSLLYWIKVFDRRARERGEAGSSTCQFLRGRGGGAYGVRLAFLLTELPQLSGVLIVLGVRLISNILFPPFWPKMIVSAHIFFFFFLPVLRLHWDLQNRIVDSLEYRPIKYCIGMI